jgi:uncharacterized protein (DUF58 family)
MRIRYHLYRVWGWVWSRAQRRFTRAGLAIVGAMMVVGLTGLDPDLSASYQAFSLLVCLVLVAFSLNWSFRRRFSATRLLPAFGTAGVPFSYRVLVRNLARETQSGLTLLENLREPRPTFREWQDAQLAERKLARSFRFNPLGRANPFKLAKVREASVPTAAPGQETEVKVELTPLRRGVLHFTGVVLARPDPLGLLRALTTVPLPQTALILPRRYPLPPIALPGTLKYQEGGVALAANVGQSEEFVALRDYRHGDPMRHIHWRSWARVGKPVVKEFEDEFFVRHALVLDTFTDHHPGELFEEAVSVAASFVCSIETQESLLDLLFVGPQSYCFTAGRGLAHADQMLEILASVRPCREQPFRALEHLVLNHVSALSGCICVFVAWDDERRRFVAKLRSLRVPVLALVIVEPGGRESLDPGPLRAEPDCFHALEVGEIEQGLAKLK